MSQPCRIEGQGRLDRSKPLAFTFNGKTYRGYRGDTLASALLANGVRLLGRSFKYHRPRGIFTAGSEEPSALVQLEEGARTEPNVRATVIDLYDGLVARSQNCWPSVDHDLGALNNVLSRIFVAGFYYKTFMWPASWWEDVYEKLIRKAAGLGKAPLMPDPDVYGHRFAHCDVLVAGGGPAGLAAALAAGRGGARVILADEQSEFGGQLLSGGEEIDGKPALAWVDTARDELEAMEHVTLLPRTTVVGYYDANYLTALQRVTNHLGPVANGRIPRERFWKIRAKQVVLACGAIERPLVFADNDRPGIMLASAARSYVNRYGVLPGRRIVVFTNNGSAYRTALDAAAAGAEVEVVDLRPEPQGALVTAAEQAGIPVHKGSAVVSTRGKKGISSCAIARLNDEGSAVEGLARSIACDALACSGGWNPTVHLWSQARGRLSWDDDQACFRPEACVQAVRAAGACNGTFGLGDALCEGAQAGAMAAQDADFGDGSAAAPSAENGESDAIRPLYYVPTNGPVGRGKKHFHDQQNDVTAADIHLAAREGYLSVEHLKRYTTTGMGTDQGKTSNVNALAIMADIRGAQIPEVGTTTFRPPYVPVTFGAIAGPSRGELFDPRQHTPMHSWHEEQGAHLEPAGTWVRPWAYPKAGESPEAAAQRECAAVRRTCGLFDASTLGKIDVRGADAVTFLNQLYTNEWSDLPIGRCRYGLLLNDRGMVFDDGVTTRLGEDHFHVTTTSGGAARAVAWFEEWLQTEWPELQVHLTNVVEQWAVGVVCGPQARDLLQGVTDLDLNNTAFPFMAMQEGQVAGVPARVFRVSFSGELSYEINVPARYGLHLWQALMARGKDYGLCPFGTEALHILRAERGFILVGQDTDGTVTPMDLGMNWIVAKNKGDFIGRRSFACQELRRPGRKQLVGLLSENPAYVLPQGVHLMEDPSGEPPLRTIGHVTSSYMSPNLGRSIALALVEDGRKRFGEVLKARTIDGHVEPVELTKPVFFDPKGTRANG